MKKILALILLIGIAHGEDYNGIVKISKHSKNSTAHVSGVVISADNEVRILSCWHLMMEPGNVSVTFYKENENVTYEADVLKTNKDWDLGLYRVKKKVQVEVFPLGETPKIGDKCQLYGFAANGPYNHYVTIKNEKAYTMGGELLFACNGKAVHGLSGTPLLHNSRIVGIQSCGSDEVVHGASVITIKKFLGRIP